MMEGEWLDRWEEVGRPDVLREWYEAQSTADRAPAAQALPEYLSTAQVGQMVGKTAKTIRRAIAAGRLSAVGGPPMPYRIHRDVADQFARASTAPRRRVTTAKVGGKTKPVETSARDLVRKANR